MSDAAQPVAPTAQGGRYELCERCPHDYWLNRRSLPRTPEHDPMAATAATRASSQLKPVGEPCPTCGDNSPRGTWPWVGPMWSRVRALKSDQPTRYVYAGNYRTLPGQNGPE